MPAVKRPPMHGTAQANAATDSADYAVAVQGPGRE